MSKKGMVFRDPSSKRRVTIQIRDYTSEGKYATKKEEKPYSIRVEGVEIDKVKRIIEDALRKAFGPAEEE